MREVISARILTLEGQLIKEVVRSVTSGRDAHAATESSRSKSGDVLRSLESKARRVRVGSSRVDSNHMRY